MKYLIELEVREEDYKDFIEYFDPTFDDWDNEDEVEDKVYDLLRHEGYSELVDCPYIWVDER